jgi:putative ATP-dependent endonuclease of OLD family
MKIYSLAIENFRGIRSAEIVLPHHAVLLGDNNTGKSSLLEAIDLVLGPDRLSRRPPIDEHDFYQGGYRAVAAEGNGNGTTPTDAAKIKVEVTITDLSQEQQARFGDYVEWLNTNTGGSMKSPTPPASTTRVSTPRSA